MIRGLLRSASARRADGRARAPVLTAAACTDTGLVRRSNEDAFLCRPEVRLWAVADGMGGHEDGEWASAAIAAALEQAPLRGDFDADRHAVAAAIHAANASIHGRAEAGGVRMGSTVAALLLGDTRFAVVWAGDSRAYRLRGGEFAQLTTDHTQVQSKVARGLMTPAEARAHPMAHVLTRAVGAEPVLELSTLEGDLAPGDRFLLCSDGLHGGVRDPEIAAVLASHAPEAACERLVAMAHAHGAPDNVTVVVVAAAP